MISTWLRCVRSALLLLSSLALLPLASPAQAAPPAGYYDSIDASSSATLRSTVHQVIRGHMRIPYSSSGTDTWTVLESAQQDPLDASHILDVYLNASYAKTGGGSGVYDREHTWPKSHGFPDDGATNYPYSNCHMLHLSNATYNSSRGNTAYGTCSACTIKPTLANNVTDQRRRAA